MSARAARPPTKRTERVKKVKIVTEKVATGRKSKKHENQVKKPTPSTLLTQVVTELQKIDPDVLTNAAIKEAVSKVEGIPRNFPSEWGGRGKKPRPPGKPKGPKNEYIIFATEIRDQVRKENPGVPNSAPRGQTSITSIIGQRWSNLKDRSVYEKRAKEDNERYEREMKVWEEKNPEFARVSKAPKEPKRTTGYILFCKEKREEVVKKNPNVGGRDINSKVAIEWQALSKEEQNKYHEQATELNKNLPNPPAPRKPTKKRVKKAAKSSEGEETD